MKSLKKIGLLALMAIAVLGTTSCGSSGYISSGVQYTNPVWAPQYYAGVRYYYLPDIECYYDLSTQEFAYLDNGQWLFSYSLPGMYAGYDLYNGFVVALNHSIYQPWLHHQNYISHYPRYYYHNVYNGTQYAGVRGFNENERKPFYRNQENRNTINNNRDNDFNKKIDVPREQPRQNERQNPPQKIAPVPEPQQRPNDAPRQPQKPIFRGKDLGKPVKVKPYMRETKSTTSKPGGDRPDRKGRD